MYARLKGVPNDLIDDTVQVRVTPWPYEQKTILTIIICQGFIDMMDLGAHADKLTGGYSGGNKRRLSLAIALIGS